MTTDTKRKRLAEESRERFAMLPEHMRQDPYAYSVFLEGEKFGLDLWERNQQKREEGRAA